MGMGQTEDEQAAGKERRKKCGRAECPGRRILEGSLTGIDA